jgi:hypothetical protein
MIEKDTDERVCYSSIFFDFNFLLTTLLPMFLKISGCRFRKRWRPQWTLKLPGDWQSANVRKLNV